MSWDAYTKTLVDQKVELCAIYGLNGSPWTQVPEFTLSSAELTPALTAMKNSDTSIYGSGLTMAGKRFTVLSMSPEQLVLKGKDKDNAKQNMVVMVGKQAVVVGANKEDDVPAPHVVNAVGKLMEYLKTCGY